MTTPSAFLLGAQKAGTTWLASRLDEHPQLSIGRDKEAHFFDHPELEVSAEEFFAEHFTTNDPARPSVFLDATPNYLCHPDVPARVAQTCPDARFIAVLRNPVDRARSALSHHVSHRRLPADVHASSYITDILNGAPDTWQVVEFSDYLGGIRRWLEYVDRERFLFLVFETELATNGERSVQRSLEHLELDRASLPDELTTVPENVTPKSSLTMRLARSLPGGPRAARLLERLAPQSGVSMSGADELAQRFRPDLSELEEITGCSLSHWYN